VVEKDIHPRDHVGEALTPSTNFVLDRIGVLPKLEEAGFFHKSGVGWTAPRSKPWRFLAVRTSEYPPPHAVQPYSYNVERKDFDALLLRHAHESGAKVLHGVTVREVLFEDSRAVGVRVQVADGWERDLRAKAVIDASGRRCLLASQLRMKKKDPNFNQFSIYSWFRNVQPPPSEYHDFLFLHFLKLERAWAWHIPLRDGKFSMGVVTKKDDFTKSGKSEEDFFESFMQRNRTLAAAMEGAVRIRDWEIEGDYSYRMERFTGPGWLLVGDALRFVDPIFSSGVDVALYSAMFAHETLENVWAGGEEAGLFADYEKRVTQGVDIWYELTDLFYRFQLLFTLFLVKRDHRAQMVRVLQGNPYLEDTQQTARSLIDKMWSFHEQMKDDERSLFRPSALSGA
jgi:FADH2 O2-dependent halogenase